MIKTYVKKPIVVKAVQWTGDNLNEIQNFCHNNRYSIINDKFTIYSLKGDMVVSTGDWIIKGVAGECYPCKPDIFELTYEEI